MSILNLNTLPTEDLAEIISFGGPKFVGQLREIDSKINDTIHQNMDCIFPKSHPVCDKLNRDYSLLQPYPWPVQWPKNKFSQVALRVHFVKTIQQIIQKNRNESDDDFQKLASRLHSEYNEGHLRPKAPETTAKRLRQFYAENLDETTLGDLFFSCVLLGESDFLQTFDLKNLDKNTIYLSILFCVINNNKDLFNQLLQHIPFDDSETHVLETLMRISIEKGRSEMFKDLLERDHPNQKALQGVIHGPWWMPIEEKQRLVSYIAKSESEIDTNILLECIWTAVEEDMEDEIIKDLLERDHLQQALTSLVTALFLDHDEANEERLIRLMHVMKSEEIIHPSTLAQFIQVALERDVEMLPNLLQRNDQHPQNQQVLQTVFSSLIRKGSVKEIKTLMRIYFGKLKKPINADLLTRVFINASWVERDTILGVRAARSASTFEAILNSIGNTYEEVSVLQSSLSELLNIREKKRANNDADETFEMLWDGMIGRIKDAIEKKAPIHYDACEREEEPKRRRLN